MAIQTTPSEGHEKFVNQVCSNTQTDLIEITEDKLENILLKHLDKLKAIKAWETPLALFISILVTVLTTEFKSFYFSASVWTAVFIIGLLISFLWLLRSCYILYLYFNECSIEHIIKLIKDADKN